MKAHRSIAWGAVAAFCLASGVCAQVSHDTAHLPVGVPKGIYPGRVVWVHDPRVTLWDGSSGYSWEEESVDQPACDGMVSDGLRALTGASTDRQAWDLIFTHYNSHHGRSRRGYRIGEKVVIKVNLNPSKDYDWASSQNPEFRPKATSVSPHLVYSLITQLVEEAGVRESDIAVYDASRLVGDPVFDYCRKRFRRVRFVDRVGVRGRIKAKPDLRAPVYFADPSVPGSGSCYVPACATQAAYAINLAMPKSHKTAGVSLCAKNYFGSFWRKGEPGRDGWYPRNLHPYIETSRPEKSYNPLVDLLGHEQLGGKTVLFILDGFYAARGSSGPPVRWDLSPFDGHWPSSLFLSQDPVAIDSVGYDLLRGNKATGPMVKGSAQDYLHEAALAYEPPSGVTYDPENDGTELQSLGVHEHWNDPVHKQYSGNLQGEGGIELVLIAR